MKFTLVSLMAHDLPVPSLSRGNEGQSSSEILGLCLFSVVLFPTPPLLLLQVVSSARGLGWVDLTVPLSVLCCLPWADGNLAEAARQLGKMVDQPNQSQPNPGLDTLYSVATNATCSKLYASPRSLGQVLSLSLSLSLSGSALCCALLLELLDRGGSLS